MYHLSKIFTLKGEFILKAAIYTRVSTEEQKDEGYSLSAQFNLIKDYCSKNDLIPYDVYSDEGISGQKEDRPEFQRMIKDAEKGLFNVILVHKFDRFARKIEISQRIKSRLKKASINVISITEPIEDSPIGFFQEGLIDLLSEYFIRNLAKEVKKGLNERASQGHHNGCLPYGYYSKNDGNAYINEEQAQVIRKIFELYVSGNGYSKIVQYLKDNRIPSSNNKHWRQHTVLRIIRNVKYVGLMKYDGKIYDSKLEPIVSKEIFEAAQLARGIKSEKQKNYYRGSNTDKYLFLGFIACGQCAHSFRIKTSKVKDYRIGYYVCSMATTPSFSDVCDFKKYHNSKRFEEYVISEIHKIAFDVDAEIKIFENSNISVFTNNRDSKIKIELKRAKEAYLAGVFTLAEFSEIKIKLEKELADITPKQNDSYNSNKTTLVKDKLKKALRKLESINDIPTKKAILREIIHVIEVHPNKISIICRA
jgi:site-specific DNA recombinase